MTTTPLIDKLLALGAAWCVRPHLDGHPLAGIATESQLRALVDAETEELRAQRDRLLVVAGELAEAHGEIAFRVASYTRAPESLWLAADEKLKAVRDMIAAAPKPSAPQPPAEDGRGTVALGGGAFPILPIAAQQEPRNGD